MSVINTNLKALVSTESMRSNNLKLSTAMERLSTGLRINSAKDDAAGLAISNRMTAQVRGFAMATKNANDGISMAQTADGAYGQVTSMLQRMRELSVQAANGSMTKNDRESIQLEIDELKMEIQNVATKTNFNGINLLDGSARDIKLQTGTKENDLMSIGFGSVQTKDIGSGAKPALTSLGGSASTYQALENGDLVINGVLVGASLATDDNLSPTVAEVQTLTIGASPTASGTVSVTFATLTGTKSTELELSAATATATATAIATTINQSTSTSGVTAVASDNVVKLIFDKKLGDVAAATFVTGGTASNAAATVATVAHGHASEQIAASALAKAEAINRVTEFSGVYAQVNDTRVLGSTMTASALSGAISINGYTTAAFSTTSDAAASRAIVTKAINDISGATGVRAIDTLEESQGVLLVADDGRNINLNIPSSFEVQELTIDVSATTTGTASITVQTLTGQTTFTQDMAGITKTAAVTAIATTINNSTATSGVTAVNSGNVLTLIYDRSLSNVGAATFAASASGAAASVATVVEGGGLTAAATGLGQSGNYIGTYSLYSKDGSAISVDHQIGKTQDSFNKTGLRLGSFEGDFAQVVSDRRATTTSALNTTSGPGILNGGTLVINDIAIAKARAVDDTASHVAIGSQKEGSAIAIAAAINRSTDLHGVTAKAEANVLRGTGFTATASSGTLSLNGVSINVNALTRNNVIDSINENTGQTGVVAKAYGDGIELVAEDGRNIVIGTSLTAANLGLTDITVGTQGAPNVYYASVSLISDKAFTVARGSEGGNNFANLGFREGTFGGKSTGLKVAEVNVTTQLGAGMAITAIDHAINDVAASQARSGAFQNRLEAAVSILAEQSENTQAARSRILDTDYAQETTALAKAQIVQQAATAMLAQANQQQQLVLALLQ